MKHYFCSCCDREFTSGLIFYAIRDGKKLLHLHGECIPVFSCGIELEEIEEKCSVVVENNIYVNGGGAVWRKSIGGIIHRVGGPAIEYCDGDEAWYENGLQHREDGPSSTYHNSGKRWHVKGGLHRVDGPAVEYKNGDKEWWENGRRISHSVDSERK